MICSCTIRQGRAIVLLVKVNRHEEIGLSKILMRTDITKTSHGAVPEPGYVNDYQASRFFDAANFYKKKFGQTTCLFILGDQIKKKEKKKKTFYTV